METEKKDWVKNNRVFLWAAFLTLFVLTIPAVAMKFTDEINWGLEDFTTIGILIFGTGSLFVMVSRILPRKFRSFIAIAAFLLVLWLWVELAVGLFTNWGS